MHAESTGPGPLDASTLAVFEALTREPFESGLEECVGGLAALARSTAACLILPRGEGPPALYLHPPTPAATKTLESHAREALPMFSANPGAWDWPSVRVEREGLEAIPLVAEDRLVGVLCIAVGGRAADRGLQTIPTAVIQLVARRISDHDELARLRRERSAHLRWMRTFDQQLRVLDRERQKFAAVVSQSDLYAFVADTSRVIRWTNRAVSALPPLRDASEWIGRSCREFCGSLMRDPAGCERCPVGEAIERNSVEHSDLRCTHSSVVRNYYLTALPIRGPEGNASEIVVLLQDLTVLQVVQSSEARYRNLFERSGNAIVMVNPETLRVVLANPTTHQLLGWEADDARGLALRDLHPAAEWERLEPVYARTFRTDQRERFECVLVDRNGVEHAGVATISRFDLDGEDVGMLEFQDFTERKRAELALRASETLKGAILETALDAIITMDHEGRVLEFNPAAERVFGYRRDAAIGRILADLVIPAGMREAHRRGLERHLVTGETRVLDRRLEMTAIRADGREIPVELAIARIPQSDPPVFAGFIRDLTERRQAEDALRRSEEQLRQVQKLEAVGRLAGGVAHDFNNLLTVIMGRSERIRDQIGLSHPLRHDAEQIHGASLRGAWLTRQLLAFSRREIVTPSVLDLAAVVTEMEGMLRRLIGEDIELVSSGPIAGAHVQLDRGQVEQVVMNLVVNARDAMPEGGVLEIEIALLELGPDSVAELGLGEAGRYVRLRVTDNGCGMDERTRSHVFEPFFTTKEPGQGTGLGLSIVHGIVSRGGGKVDIESAPGRGTTVRVYLPRAEPDAGSETAGGDAAGSQHAGRETVLVVEDDDAVRAITREALECEGYQVLEAEGGPQALDLAARYHGTIHLTVTDVVMPQMSGSELARRLAAERPGLRFLFVSGYTDDGILRHGVLAGEVPFMHKPFALEAMTRKVREILDDPLPARIAAGLQNSPSGPEPGDSHAPDRDGAGPR